MAKIRIFDEAGAGAFFAIADALSDEHDRSGAPTRYRLANGDVTTNWSTPTLMRRPRCKSRFFTRSSAGCRGFHRQKHGLLINAPSTA